MIITAKNIGTAFDQSVGNPGSDLKRLIQTPTTPNLWHAAVILITRGGQTGPDQTPEELQEYLEEIVVQSAVLYLALAPIWDANKQQLPDVSRDEVSRTLGSLKDTCGSDDQYGYFEQLKAWNPLWYRSVSLVLDGLRRPASRTFCEAIVKSVIDKLPEPIEPSPIDIGGDMLEHL